MSHELMKPFYVFFFFINFQQEKQVADALSAAESWQSRHAHEVKDRSKLEIELSLLNRYLQHCYGFSSRWI